MEKTTGVLLQFAYNCEKLFSMEADGRREAARFQNKNNTKEERANAIVTSVRGNIPAPSALNEKERNLPGKEIK